MATNLATAADEGSWDIVRDLHFLIASDDQLQGELAHVCDLLNAPEEGDATPSDKTSEEGDTSSDGTPKAAKKPAAATRGKRKTCGTTTVRFETRQKEEIMQLQAQVMQLKAQLEERQLNAGKATQGVSAWEKAARHELTEKNKSLRENEQLRDAMHEQATFIEHMQSIFAKKPRLAALSDTTSEAWQEYKLAAQSSLREAAIHAIADRQYARQQNAFINAGLFERRENLFHAGPRTLPDKSIVLEFIYHMTLPAPYDVVGGACWQVYNGKRPPTLAPGANSEFETLDNRTVYNKYWEPSVLSLDGEGYNMNISNTIHKLYVEDDRHVIVWRAVLEDALMPSMMTGNVGNEWGWIAIAPHPDDATQCQLSILGQVQKTNCYPAHECGGPDKMLEDVTSFLEKLEMGKPPAVPGTFPSHPVQRGEEDEELKFLNRGKRLEQAIEKSINDAVVAYRTKNA
ncbi:Aste57867_23745 [Aphanomyces stellatus]|uniref:Aste57867_23745 protein n=1 Tax=Aphanomyces stellatus TaxID=120398 RepID=A0A485LQ61_9STRA|nr:hypothetical protein As57867_023673 [Aphanomyces stellatus]VFU00390.1 Aste57867_23745 [Aphanomyces stellatus]